MEIKDWRRLHVTIGALLLITASAVSPAASAAGPRADFNIPAGDAQNTLLQFYVQSGVQVLYLAQAVQNISTRAISGNLEASEALAKMLQGTGLLFEFESSTSAVVRTDSPPPASFGAGDAAEPAFAEQTATPQSRDITPPGVYGSGPTGISEVTVTGTHIRGVLDVMSPLEVVTREDLKRTAYATVQDAMQNLPLNFGAPQSEDFGGTGNFSRGSALNLRGLGAGATLVLVNGRRQPQAGIQSDFVDVSNIPWSVIERIEVLPDGTSALYGSDAIAGVVNIITRKSLDGAESQGRLAMAPDGGTEILAAQLLGHHWESGNILVGYQYSRRTALAAADRAYAAYADKRELGGVDHSSFRSNPGNILNPATLAPAFAIPRGQDGAFLQTSDLLPGITNLQHDPQTFNLLPDRKTHSAFFSATQRLGERVELSGESRYNQRDIRWQGSAEERLLLVPPTNPFFVDPFGGSPFVIVAYNFMDDLGPLAGNGETSSYTAALGLKADLTAHWQATLSSSYGRENIRWTAHNVLDPSGQILNLALEDPDPATAFNPFGDGSSTHPATLAAIESTQRSRATSKIVTTNLVADGPLFSLPTGAARIAVGAESRQEDLGRTLIGRDLLYTPQQYQRHIVAGFAELSVPLIGSPDNARATPRLELSAAGRYEEYSDFGNTFNPKIGLRWTPHEAIKLRASWGTSFKAPRLVDLYDTSQDISGLALFPDPRSPTKQSIVMVRQGSNPGLNEETATTLTAGLDLAPRTVPGLTLSLTGYAINYKDQVLQPGSPAPFEILSQEERWTEVIARNPSRAAVDTVCNSSNFMGSAEQCRGVLPAAIIDMRLRNLAATQLSGLDMKLDYSRDTPIGHFRFGLNGGYILTFDQAFTSTSAQADVLDTVGNALEMRLRGMAEWNQRGLNSSGLSISAFLDHTGGYRNSDSIARPAVDAWTTVDLHVRYRASTSGRWLDNLEVGFNADNIFDADPPFVDIGQGYDPVNAEPAGRVVGFYLQKNW